MEKRKIITNGLGWVRFLLVPVILFVTIQMLSGQFNGQNKASIIVLLAIAFFLLTLARRLHYDEKGLYFIRGKQETLIPFRAILSIKRSATKVNGSRYWVLKHGDATGKVRTIRYYGSYDAQDFINLALRENPDITFWAHPHFHD